MHSNYMYRFINCTTQTSCYDFLVLLRFLEKVISLVDEKHILQHLLGFFSPLYYIHSSLFIYLCILVDTGTYIIKLVFDYAAFDLACVLFDDEVNENIPGM